MHGNAGDFTLQAQYEPIDCLIAKQKRSDNIKKVEYLDMKKELEGLQYFTVNLGTSLRGTNIANYETTDEAEIQKRLYYLSFKMQKDFKLVEGSDTLPCRLYHFEKMNDFANVKTISLAFDKRTEGNDKDKTLIVDSPLLNSEPIKLNFDIKNIKNIPPLKTL